MYLQRFLKALYYFFSFIQIMGRDFKTLLHLGSHDVMTKLATSILKL